MNTYKNLKSHRQRYFFLTEHPIYSCMYYVYLFCIIVFKIMTDKNNVFRHWRIVGLKIKKSNVGAKDSFPREKVLKVKLDRRVLFSLSSSLQLILYTNLLFKNIGTLSFNDVKRKLVVKLNDQSGLILKFFKCS